MSPAPPRLFGSFSRMPPAVFPVQLISRGVPETAGIGQVSGRRRVTDEPVETVSERCVYGGNGWPTGTCQRRSFGDGGSVLPTFAEDAAQDEQDVCRPLAEAAHEVRKPFTTERDVDTDA